MSVFVVLIHNSSYQNYTSLGVSRGFLGFLQFFFKSSLTSIAVPLFFIISGFTFYINFDYSKIVYKLKKRFSSLVIPYWIWNFLYLLFALITSYSFLSNFFIGRDKVSLSCYNIITGILFHDVANSHFWYVFNLIVFVLMCPVIYTLLKNKFVGLGVIAALYILFAFFPTPSYWIEFLFCHIDSVIYYLIGAYIGIHYADFFTMNYSKGLCIASLAFLGIFGYYNYLGILNDSLKTFMNVLACASFWIAADLFSKIKIRDYMTVSFFIYASHGIVEPIMVKSLYIILPKISWMAAVNLILSTTLTVVLCAGVGVFIRNHIRPLNKLLTGNR